MHATNRTSLPTCIQVPKSERRAGVQRRGDHWLAHRCALCGPAHLVHHHLVDGPAHGGRQGQLLCQGQRGAAPGHEQEGKMYVTERQVVEEEEEAVDCPRFMVSMVLVPQEQGLDACTPLLAWHRRMNKKKRLCKPCPAACCAQVPAHAP
eukprot:1152307-Pelagomonas_calceolata.AAC.6